jgi:hypothetical protein
MKLITMLAVPLQFLPAGHDRPEPSDRSTTLNMLERRIQIRLSLPTISTSTPSPFRRVPYPRSARH